METSRIGRRCVPDLFDDDVDDMSVPLSPRGSGRIAEPVSRSPAFQRQCAVRHMSGNERSAALDALGCTRRQVLDRALPDALPLVLPLFFFASMVSLLWE